MGKSVYSIVLDDKVVEAVDELLPTALALVRNPERVALLEKNAKAMALRNASQIICDEIYKLV